MSTKWAEIADSRMPAREFARTILSDRLEGVETLLGRASEQHDDDIEHVHQLRVGCRRAAAALRAFTPLMGKKPKKLKRWLSMIRSAAGRARDIDVLVARFGNENDSPVKEYALARLQKERLQVQAPLVDVAKRASRGRLDEAIDVAIDLLSDGKSKKSRLDKFGRKAVRLAYVPFARLAVLENPTMPEWHELRIAGKRLRYSLEIFYGLDPALVDRVYLIVEELQSRLGELNDRATAQALYQSWLGGVPADALGADLAGRVSQEYKDAQRLRGQFLRWWNHHRVAKMHELVTQFVDDAPATD
jgi:CHAD domain-containing protein